MVIASNFWLLTVHMTILSSTPPFRPLKISISSTTCGIPWSVEEKSMHFRCPQPGQELVESRQCTSSLPSLVVVHRREHSMDSRTRGSSTVKFHVARQLDSTEVALRFGSSNSENPAFLLPVAREIDVFKAMRS